MFQFLFSIFFLFVYLNLAHSYVSIDKSRNPELYKSRVSGGHIARIEDHPYQVQLFPTKCGGTIIDKKWILSAWICYHPNLTVLVGHDSIEGITSGNVEVKRIYHHHKHREDYPIMLIELLKPLEFNKTISSVNYRKKKRIYDGTIGMVAGFGARDGYVQHSPFLHAVETRIVTHDKCIETLPTYKEKLSRNHDVDFCGGYDRAEISSLGGHHSHCKGDYGSGLVVKGSVIGVAVHSVKCGFSKNPGVFASVPFARHWIKRVIKKNKGNEDFQEMVKLDIGIGTK